MKEIKRDEKGVYKMCYTCGEQYYFNIVLDFPEWVVQDIMRAWFKTWKNKLIE